jgi:3-phenylpropionate/trans-cinnamate dioxygenase ferredoxin reductase subunit
MDDVHSVVVIGASAAGLSAVEALRAEGYRGSIRLVGSESHLPYDRPPLSKQILAGTWDRSRLELRPEEHYQRLDIQLALGQRATGLDLQNRTISLERSEPLHFDRLIIATGANARRLPILESASNVFYLRTIEDAFALSTVLRSARSIAVIGAGFVGTEVAAAARKSGVAVTLIDAGDNPLAQRLGALVGSRVARLHSDNGVVLRMRTSVLEAIRNGSNIVELKLGNGDACACDAVIVAVGADPETAWLNGSSLQIVNGVECDEHCRAADGIYAAGDVANWFHPGYGRRLRIEHRTNASEQGVAAARNLLGIPTVFCPIPFFWSDQYDVKLQSFGILPANAQVSYLYGSAESGAFVAGYFEEERLVGVLGWNAAKETRTHVATLSSLWTHDIGLVRMQGGAGEAGRLGQRPIRSG